MEQIVFDVINEIADHALVPKASDDVCWQFPSGLYGTRTAVRQFSKKTVKRMTLGGEVDELLCESDRSSVLTSVGDLVVADNVRSNPKMDRAWWMCELANAIQDQCRSKSDRTELLMPMMESLWGCILLLDPLVVSGSKNH